MMTVIMMSGQEFKEARKRLRLKQDALGEVLACTRQTISAIENKPVVPPLYALAIRALEQNAA